MKADNNVIVIEGLDATGKHSACVFSLHIFKMILQLNYFSSQFITFHAGKTTLCKRLSESIQATQLGTPPRCISHLRHVFDDHPPLVRRAYYSLGNYLAAQEIVEATERGPCCLDRWDMDTLPYH